MIAEESRALIHFLDRPAEPRHRHVERGPT
jgi:hypothetical protein